MKILYLYRYCILGGVCTQLSNRLPSMLGRLKPHFGFLEDHGGLSAFEDYEHTSILPNESSLVELVRRGGFDMVLPIDTPEVYPILAKAGYRGTIVNEVHTTTSNLRYLASLHAEKVDAILAPSRYLVERIGREYVELRQIPLRVTPNCLDTRMFQYSSPTAIPDGPVLLWVGKLDPHKNWRDFLRIGRLVVDQGADCQLWIVGGETARARVAEEMLDTAMDIGVLERLRWMPRVEYRHMPRVYSLATASGGMAVSTSQDESFGMSVVEALACECPVMAASVGGIPEILDGELADFLFPWGDLEAAQRNILRCLERPSEWRRIARRGRVRVVRRYGLKKAGQKYVDTLLEIRRQVATSAAGRKQERPRAADGPGKHLIFL